VGGSSYGGLASSFAAFQHPEVFGNVLSQSGSYWWKPEEAMEDEWLTRRFALAPKLALRFYMDVGLRETSKITDTGPNHRLGNRHMRDVLEAKGYRVTYVEYNGGHDYIWWQGTLADGLLALLKGRKWKSIWKGR
jgi:enterochelin esterase family protein